MSWCLARHLANVLKCSAVVFCGVPEELLLWLEFTVRGEREQGRRRMRRRRSRVMMKRRG